MIYLQFTSTLSNLQDCFMSASRTFIVLPDEILSQIAVHELAGERRLFVEQGLVRGVADLGRQVEAGLDHRRVTVAGAMAVQVPQLGDRHDRQ